MVDIPGWVSYIGDMEAHRITEANNIDGHRVTEIQYGESYMLIIRATVPAGEGRTLCVNYTDQIETD